MCLAVPMEIKTIDDEMALCAVEGITVKASIALVPDAVVGDWVIVHAGYAIEILDEREAAETLKLFAEIEEAYRAAE